MVRKRFHPIAIAGDLKQDFLQVRIWESNRDVLRFHWYKNLETREIEELRFTRALFAILGGVLEEHLKHCRERFPADVDEIVRSLYVEDDVELPVLTFNALLFGQPNVLPEMDPKEIEDSDLRRRAKYLLKCKEALWQRWTREHVRELCKRHNIIHQTRAQKTSCLPNPKNKIEANGS